MAWSKVKIYYQKGLSALTATSTAAGYSVQNLYNMLESTLWKATSSSDQYITFDAGNGNTYTADYIAIANHNLKTIGATLTLQYSDNGTDWLDAFTGFAVASDKALVKEFTSQAKRYWRVKLSGMTGVPFMAICIWGPLVELGYVYGGSFDPNEQDDKANVNISSTGYLLGIHDTYCERTMAITFKNATDALYQKINIWREASGLNNFFVAWNLAGDSSAVYLMRPADGKFKNPYQAGGTRRQITINLKGRKE